MTHRFTIADTNAPDLKLWIEIPPQKANEIKTHDGAAINFARSLLSDYHTINGKEQKFYHILDDHKFYIDFLEKDEAVMQIMLDHCLHGTYEPHTTQLIKDVVKSGDICIDVGASIGYFTLLFARQAGVVGRVYSIEATANQFPYLLQNIDANGYKNVVSFNVAAWDTEIGTEEEVTINANANQKNKVKATSLDALITDPVDFIKMDIDGSEPRALKGFLRTIEASPNLKMVIEYYPEYQRKIGNNPDYMMWVLDKYFTYEKIEGDHTDEYWNYYCVRK